MRVTESVGGEEAWSFSYRVQSGLWRPSKQRNAISIAHSLLLQTSNLAVARKVADYSCMYVRCACASVRAFARDDFASPTTRRSLLAPGLWASRSILLRSPT